MEQTGNKLVPRYAARVENLRPGTWVVVICSACGHAADIASATIQARLPGYLPVDALEKKLRCDRCGTIGKVVVDSRRALGYA